MIIKRYLSGNKLGNLWNDAFREAYHGYLAEGCSQDRAMELADIDAQAAVDSYCVKVEHGLLNGKQV